MGLQPDSTFGCKLCGVRLQPGCMHGVAGGTCRLTARASSSTRARCSCWASGATARIRRRSGRARSCDSSSGGSTWPQARAMPVWLFLALGGRIAAFGHACVWRIQATATSSAPAALHVLLTIVCRPELPRGARESRRAARLRPGERGRPPQQRRCRAAAKDPLLRQECNNNITVPLASPYTDPYLFLRQECGGNPKSKPKPHSDPNPTPNPTPTPNPNLTLRQECGGPIGR